MLKEDGTPVLTDFGSARQMVAARSRSVTAVVTPGYATLEQYSTHGKQGPWTDIYALSAVAYRCITGTVPLDATERVQADELMLASEIGRWGYPVGLLTAVDMGLSLKSEDRPQDLTRGVRYGASRRPGLRSGTGGRRSGDALRHNGTSETCMRPAAGQHRTMSKQ